MTTAEYQQDAAATLRTRLSQCKERLAGELSLHQWRAAVTTLQVEQFLMAVLEREAGTAPPARPAVWSGRQQLHLAISVLFKWLRKDLRDTELVSSLRSWLDSCVAALLGSATLYDHLFLLNHIMRCPAGVGEWAAHYIQPPAPVTDLQETSFDSPQLSGLVTLLATVLLPVRERSQFLLEWRLAGCGGQEEAGDQDRVWTVLDGEGSEEEDPMHSWAQLREADLVALLAQIPVDHMFRYVLRVERRDGREWYEVSHSTHLSLLKLFAFSTQFVLLLREGLRTFNTPKYRQFAKRLGRLIRHTVHYVSDHWANFQLVAGSDQDPALLARIQVEYDNFFLRATRCIFSSPGLGTWQFLADIPFATISAGMLWRIFYVLHLDYREEHHSDFGEEIKDWSSVLASPDLQLQFEEKCCEAGETEVLKLHYLLAVFISSFS